MIETISIILSIVFLISLVITSWSSRLGALMAALGTTVWPVMLSGTDKQVPPENVSMLNIIKRMIVPAYQKWSIQSSLHINMLVIIGIITASVYGLTLFNIVNFWYYLLVCLMFVLHVHAFFGTMLTTHRLNKMKKAYNLLVATVDLLNIKTIAQDVEYDYNTNLLNEVLSKKTWEPLTTDYVEEAMRDLDDTE